MLKFAHKTVMTDNPHYDPARLLDSLHDLLNVKNDRQLAARLGVEAAQICKIRKRRCPVSAALLISMHEETRIPLRQLRALMGDYRIHTGPKATHPTLPQIQVLEGIPIMGPRSSHLPADLPIAQRV
jgi:transcriptional regulator with XRE-family HTH domain